MRNQAGRHINDAKKRRAAASEELEAEADANDAGDLEDQPTSEEAGEVAEDAPAST